MSTEFSENQFSLAYPDDIHNNWWHLARNRIIAHIIETFIGPNAAVLEVGCGRGIVVKHLRDEGIECFGVELADVQPIIQVRDYVSVGIDACNLPSKEKERYDTILLLDVIEHIADPITFVQKLISEFPNLSNVVITVPARQELWSNFDDFYGHYRRYTITMLKEVFLAVGSSKTWESYFFHLAYPVGLIANRIMTRQTEMRPPKSLLSRWIHKAISFVMIADYYFLPRYVPGMSIIAYLSVSADDNHRQKR